MLPTPYTIHRVFSKPSSAGHRGTAGSDQGRGGRFGGVQAGTSAEVSLSPPPPPRLPGSSSASRCQPGRPSVWAAQSACPRLPESQKLLDTDGDYGKTPVPAFLSWVGSRFSHAGLAAMRAPTPTFSRATFLPATRLLTKTPPSCPIRGGIRIYEGSSGESEMTNTSRCSLAMRSVWGSSQVTASACRVRSADRRMRRGSDESHWSFSSGRG